MVVTFSLSFFLLPVLISQQSRVRIRDGPYQGRRKARPWYHHHRATGYARRDEWNFLGTNNPSQAGYRGNKHPPSPLPSLIRLRENMLFVDPLVLLRRPSGENWVVSSPSRIVHSSSRRLGVKSINLVAPGAALTRPQRTRHQAHPQPSTTIWFRSYPVPSRHTLPAVRSHVVWGVHIFH